MERTGRTKACVTIVAVATGMIAAPSLVTAQVGSIHITVVDRMNDRPINGARVVLVGVPTTGITDGRGRAMMGEILDGSYEVRVLAIGYRSSVQLW